MDDSDLLLGFLEGVLLNLPTFLALGGGAVAAGMLGRVYPAAALRMVLGCSWLAGVYLLAIAWHTIFEPELFPDGTGAGQKVAFLILSLLEAIGFVILFTAIFAGRYPANYRRYLEQAADDDRTAPL
jgi:hypothetical protein